MTYPKALGLIVITTCIALLFAMHLVKESTAQLTSLPTIDLLAADNDQVWVKTAGGGLPEKLMRCRVNATNKPHQIECVGTSGPVTDLQF